MAHRLRHHDPGTRIAFTERGQHGARRSGLPADSALTAVAAVRALLDEDGEGLAVLLPDGTPEAARELIASMASLTVLSARIAARGRGHHRGGYLDRLVEIWTSPPG
jgi:hypothetical protein